MQRYVSESIDNPAAGDHPFDRADLVFYGVDHSGPSFEARVFLNQPDADASDRPRRSLVRRVVHRVRARRVRGRRRAL